MTTNITSPVPSEKPQTQNQLISNKRVLQLMAGGISGGVARTVTAPFERTIILQQTKNPKYLGLRVDQIISEMYNKEGFSSLFKGNWANVLRIMPFSAIELCTFEIYKTSWASLIGEKENTKKYIYLLAGACAGVTANCIVYPLDLVKTLFAFQTDTKHYNGIASSIAKIVKESGFRGLFRGLGATCIGILPYASLKLTFFQLLKNRFSENGTISVWTNLASGAIAGCLAGTITYPTDLIRRRLQIQIFQNTGAPTTGYFGIIKDVFKQDGIRGFYRGLPATYLKLIPSPAITFMLNEWLKTEWNCH